MLPSRRYSAGQAVLAADALPPLALLHECVMREATAAKQRVGCSFSISPQALEASLGALWPQLQQALDSDRKVRGLCVASLAIRRADAVDLLLSFQQ
jgi:hypothetical protein